MVFFQYGTEKFSFVWDDGAARILGGLEPALRGGRKLLNAVCHEGISMSDVHHSLVDYRVRPMLVGAHRNRKLTYKVELIGIDVH